MSVVIRAVGPWLFSLALLASASARSDERVDRLPEDHKSWLERDVVYIITERERDVFLTLESDDERNRFIEAFWRKRDPNRATPENEFEVEHYRRIAYANERLGRETFREGWQTDRGRFYIILGQPRQIQRFDGYNGLVSAHLWFYQADSKLGIPPFFYLLFYKRDDIGEYRLYHPVVDGPQALLTGSIMPTSRSPEAVERLRRVSPELAAASLSFDTSEPPNFATAQPNIGTDMMIARIEASPSRAVRTDYADAALRYGGRVSADYTFNYVPSRSAFSVLAHSGGAALVQYSIEIDPENFSMETDESRTKFYTTLDLTIEARSRDGELVVATDKEAYIELSPSQMQQIQSHPFAYQDNFALVPGSYTVSVIVRNRVLSQYTVAESELDVPHFEPGRAALTGPVLAFDTRAEDSEVEADFVYTYQLGNLRIHPASENLFVIGDTATLVSQVFSGSEDHDVVFTLEDDTGTILQTRETAPDEHGVVIDHLTLGGLTGGEYLVRGELHDPAGAVVSATAVPLTISPRTAPPRPGFVYRRGLNTRVPGLLSYMLGDQYSNLADYDRAIAAYEAAIDAGNDRVLAATGWKLANLYLKRERPDDALRVLRPLEETHSDQYEVVAGLGFAMYLKDEHGPAADYLSRAQTLGPADTTLLNALGDSLQQLGRLPEARAAFERSLELDPEQPAVTERLRALPSEPPPL